MSDASGIAIKGMSAEERLSLIHTLWDSLSDAETPITAAQGAELKRRLASFEEDRREAVSWESLKAEPLKSKD
jgi:putative addiction module component (TIGR02574 family)